MFEIVIPPNADGSPAGNGGAGPMVQTSTERANQWMAEASPRKIALPRRAGEPRFGPQPYYYEASRTGVVPAEV
jgi:hypothetical protein